MSVCPYRRDDKCNRGCKGFQCRWRAEGEDGRYVTPEKVVNRPLEKTQAVQKDVEWLIGITPTSERRNKLTEANIHLMLALQALRSIE